MALTFSNLEFGFGFWATATLDEVTGEFTVSNDLPVESAFIDGTVDIPGDSLNITTTSFGTLAMSATTVDDSGTIIFDLFGTLIVLSNTELTGGQILTYGEASLGDYVVPCFAEGTRILTRRGQVAVEDLAPGDEVVALVAGGVSRISWIGRREVDCTTATNPTDSWPVRVRAQAFGPGRPHTDLFLSHDHAVYVDDVLIPIRYLENGTSVARVQRDHITYYHVELERHDVVLAEGLPAETFLDTGNREDFDGTGREATDRRTYEQVARSVWSTEACAPLHVEGPMVAAVRARLNVRAAALGLTLPEDQGLRLRIDGVDHMPVFDGDTLVFELPRSLTGAHLVSDCFVPALTQANSNDRRCLGAAVAAIAIDGQPMRLDDFRLQRQGWHDCEDGLRWTSGVAALPPLQHLQVTLSATARPKQAINARTT